MHPRPLAFLLLLSLGGAVAQEPTASEKAFLKACTTALSDANPDVRLAAGEALVLMGPKAAAHLVRDMRWLKDDARDRAVDVLVRIGPASLEEIDRLGKLPAGAVGEALARVKEKLESKGGVAGFGTADPGVARKVEEILRKMPEDTFYSNDPHLKEIEALGRPAIPVLLDYLNPAREDLHGLRDSIAVAVLKNLCGSDDVPNLCQLLEEGWLPVSELLAEIGDPACVPVFIRVMAKGHMSWEFGSAVQAMRDPRTDEAVVRFLDEHGSKWPYGTRPLLEIVTERRLDRALPAMHRMAETTRRDAGNVVGNEVGLGRALAMLGDPSGLPLLIRNLAPDESERWSADEAGRTLNALTGLTHWSATADRAATRAAYKEWWDAHEDRLAWDPDTRRFTVKG